MNLIDAVKTRQPFRRKGDVTFYGKAFYVDFMVGDKTVALGYDDIIADDWEIKPADTEQRSE